MKLNFLKFLLSSIAIFLTSCLATTTDTIAVSSDATFVSLTFTANDSIPYLNTAVFSLVDSTIVNLDSLPYKTRIDSVFPTFSFTSTSAAFLHNLDTPANDSILITGKDTIDFNIHYKVRNYASDQISHKDYKIKVNVHKVDPELYIWNKITDLDTHQATSQKAVLLKNTIYYYQNNGSTNYLYKSNDGYNWSPSSTVSNLPNNVTFSDLTVFYDSLYLTNSNLIYKSSNGSDWTAKGVNNYNLKSILFSLNSKLWAIAQLKSDLSKYYFASSSDGVIWAVNTSDVIPNNFPTSDFSALSFSARTGKPKAIVIGGKNSNGKMGSWSTENGTYWVPFGDENHTLDTLAVGSSIIAYDNKLLLFGIKTNGTTHLKESIDEGLSWKMPNKKYNYIKDYQARSYQSALIFKPNDDDKSYGANRIFLIGGQDETTVFSDVWTGKLNRKNFLR
ncbi:MAG: DUF6242 domain-containing protein [Paludibacter sp.]